MVNTTRKAHELNIELSTKEIVMLGHSTESAGKLLQGTVVLNLTEPMKVRSIMLTFLGKVRAAWYEGSGHHQSYRSEEKDIIQHKWQFLPLVNQSNKKTYTLGSGEHKWGFELMLSGDLPQSVETETGQISYRLKAAVERPAFSQNLVKKVPVQVIRCLLPYEFELNQSMLICNTWPSKMSYDISLPSKAFSRGQLLCIAFTVRPIASRLKIRSLTCTLKEYCTYTAQDSIKVDSRVIKQKQQNDPFSSTAHSRSSEWTTAISLDIPSMASNAASCYTDCHLIKIRHKVKIAMTLINNDGHLSELRCSLPVIIMSAMPGYLDQSLLLPAYDQADQSELYLEDPVLLDDMNNQLFSILSQCRQQEQEQQQQQGQQQSEILPTDDNNNNQNVWWHGVNLCRVPSYRTASRQSQPFNLSSSLPSYDQLPIV